MIRFLIKGLLRDRSRSLFPVLIVASGVLLTVYLHAELNGVVSSLIQSTAHYSTGHVRVMTAAYAQQSDQAPNDLAILGIDSLVGELRHTYPGMRWTPRITFGGLLDIPDAHHETRVQVPVSGLAADLVTAGTPEAKILNVAQAIVRGRPVRNSSEIIVGEELALRLGVQPGDTVTLISSTMYGSMSITNFVIAGTIRFGIVAMDKATVIADLEGIQQALDMPRGAGEILGFFDDDVYHEEEANRVVADFNARHAFEKTSNPYAPVMGGLLEQSGLADYYNLVGVISRIIVGIFLGAMSVVLWNAGLTGSLRRYGEIGVRLAVGESKTHVYVTMLVESMMVGLIGSTIGTGIGLGIASYMQVHGFHIGGVMKESTLLLPDVLRAQITPATYVIGFFPGLLATFLGTAISGIGIFRRHTSELFKELEA